MLLWLGCQSSAVKEDLPTIHVGNNSQTVAYTEIIDSLIVLPLNHPDSVYFGNIDVIKVYEGEYYLLDTYQTATITVFNENGSFLRQLNQKGIGPKEYRYLENFCVDIKSRQLIINDRGKLQYLYYDLESFDFLRAERMEGVAMNIEMVNNNQNLLVFSDEQTSEDEYGGLEIKDKSLKTLVSFFKSPISAMELSFPENLSKINGESYYARPLEDVIYKIDDQNINPVIAINFGEKRVPENLWPATEAEEFETEVIKNQYYMGPHLYDRQDSLQSFWYRKGGHEKQLVLYSNKSDKSINIEGLTTDFGSGLLNPPLTLNNHFYISYYLNDELALPEDHLLNRGVSWPSNTSDETPVLLLYRFGTKGGKNE